MDETPNVRPAAPGGRPQAGIHQSLMPPRPKDVYLILGWMAGVHERNIVLFERGEDAQRLGISLTISLDGQKFFVGKLMAKLDVADGEEWRAVPQPEADDRFTVAKAAHELGFKFEKAADLWVVLA